MRFAENRRIHGHQRIMEILRNGEKADTEWFRIAWLENPEGLSRIAVLTSKKLGNAPRRNRIRRRMREVFRLHQPWVRRSVDLVLLPKAKVAQCDFADLKNAFLLCLHSQKLS